jgi:N-acetyl-anhydromuramyl-L-alanine amidase AmpD
MLSQGFVILSDHDQAALGPPATATVSKDDAWDHGGFQLGVTTAAVGGAWVDRPYFTGNPTVEWLVERANRATSQGGLCQLGNEQNLPLENWAGGSSAWFAFEDAVRAAAKDPGQLLSMPPSPGLPDWQRWVRPAGNHAVHCYGNLPELQQIVNWYLQHTDGDLYITEVNFAGGRTVDKDAWARDHLKPFLDWCSRLPRIRLTTYFAWRWPHPDMPLGSSLDAAGTQIEAIIREWESPEVPTMPDIILTVPTRTALAHTDNYRRGPRPRTIGVVVHTTRGDASTLQREYIATINWFQNPDAQVSAHLTIGPDEACRSVHDDDIAYHARTANDTHLGIEIAQPTITSPISDFQYQAAAEACRKWSEKYKFPLVRRMTQTEPGLVGHEDTESGRLDHKSDPGPVFNWDKFLQLCRGGQPLPPAPSLPALEAQVWALGDQLMKLGDQYTAAGQPHRGEYCRSEGNTIKEWVNTALKDQV